MIVYCLTFVVIAGFDIYWRCWYNKHIVIPKRYNSRSGSVSIKSGFRRGTSRVRTHSSPNHRLVTRIENYDFKSISAFRGVGMKKPEILRLL